VAVILGIAIAVWIFHRKQITRHRRLPLLLDGYFARSLPLRESEENRTLHR
jgi:hypothetical protein